MQQEEYLVAIVAVDTAENEPLKIWGWFHLFFIRLLGLQGLTGPTTTLQMDVKSDHSTLRV